MNILKRLGMTKILCSEFLRERAWPYNSPLLDLELRLDGRLQERSRAERHVEYGLLGTLSNTKLKADARGSVPCRNLSCRVFGHIHQSLSG